MSQSSGQQQQQQYQQRVKKGLSGNAMMACCKGGAHTGEYVKYVCLQEECRGVDLVLCAVCRRKSHSSHTVIEINDLFEQLKHRVNGKRVRDYSAIGALVEEAESVCLNSLSNFQQHFNSKIQQLSAAMQATFTIWKDESSLFEEKHALAVIDDITQMRQECDAVLFTNQLRKILPFISFSSDENSSASKRSVHQQLHQKPPLIKGISKNLLGLPPVSKDEVHSFQQSLLHSLKKVSDTLTDSFQSIRYAKSRSNSLSASGSLHNRSYMTEYGTAGQSQSRMNSEVDIEDYDPSQMMMYGESSENILDSISMSQSNAASGHRLSRYSLVDPAEAAQSSVGTTTVNLSKYRGQQVNSARASNTATPKRVKYMSAKGTYRAADLLSHFQRVPVGGSEFEFESGQMEDRNGLDIRRTLRSKQSSVYSQAGSQSAASTQSVHGGKYYLTNSDSAAFQTVPAAGIDSIHSVQRQVTGIQRSIDNLRGSVDFQRILSTFEEKNNRTAAVGVVSVNGVNSSQNSPIKGSLGGGTGGGKKGSEQSGKAILVGSPSTDSMNFFSQNTSVAMTPKSQIVNGGGFQNIVEQVYATGAAGVDSARRIGNSHNSNHLSNGLHSSIASSSPFGKRGSSSSATTTPQSIAPSGLWKQRLGEQQLSFAEKFSRFQEMNSARRGSSSIVRDEVIVNRIGAERDNEVYSRYIHDSQGTRELAEEEEEAKRMREVAGNQKKVHFRFSTDLHHEFVKVSKYVASGQKDSFLTRLVLLEPTVEILPHREITFQFLIKSCKNEEHTHPLALGLCHKNIVSQNNFEFAAQNLNEHSTVAAVDKVPHGCYLLTATGFLRNHAYQKQDMKKVPVRFGANDIIVCCFNPFKKTLQFTKKSSGETCILNVDTIPTDKLYPCIRISYAQDTVEYIPS